MLKAISDSLTWESDDDVELDGDVAPFAFDNLFGGVDAAALGGSEVIDSEVSDSSVEEG